MNKLNSRRLNLNRALQAAFAILSLVICAQLAQADRIQTPDGVTAFIKTLIGNDGVSRVNAINIPGLDEPVYMGDVAGENLGGHYHASKNFEIFSGYLGAAPVLPMTWRVEGVVPSTGGILVGNIWVGVPLNAGMKATVTSPLNVRCSTCPVEGLTITAIQNHMGQPMQTDVAYRPVYESGNRAVTFFPPASDPLNSDGQWSPNTLYDIRFSPSITDQEGNGLNDDVHYRFVTVLNPEEENVVLHPLDGLASIDAGAPSNAAQVMNIHLPAESLKEYSAVFLNTNLAVEPASVPPSVIEEANRKAERNYGGYRRPIAIHEVVAYNTNRQRQTVLKKPVTIALSYANALNTTAAPVPSTHGIIRPETISLFALDTTHQLWVKMAGTENDPATQSLQTSFSQLPVLAVMGGPSMSAADAKVFPNPWRPFGPRAGDSPTEIGQTGTLATGMTFTDLPSECVIKIYTINGEKVREMRHSDIEGTGPAPHQERWNGKNDSGETVASGVYLWHVKSVDDEKTGKVMIIR